MSQGPSFSRTATMSSTNWADDVEEEEKEMQREESMHGIASPRSVPPGSPLAHAGPAGYPDEERGGGGYGRGGPPMPSFQEGPPLPDRPPFKAYLGNIPYDLDEQEVAHFFHGLDIVDIIITRHHDTGKPKGCFVEFASQDHLAKALSADGEPMMRRPVRVQVAEPPRRERDGFGDRRGGFGRRGGYEERRGGGFDDRRGGGYEDRRGGGGYDDRRGGGGFADRYDRDRRDDWPSRRGPPGDERDQPSSPKERPKLVLAPRTAPAPAGGDRAADAPAAAAPSPPAEPKPRSNPFGDAKPIDTQSKLAEFEERLKAKKKEEAEAKKREKEAAAAAADKEEEAAAAKGKKEAGAAPAAAAKPAPPPPPPAAAKPAAAAAAAANHAPVPPPPAAGAAAGATDGHEAASGAGRGRGGPRLVAVPARTGGRGAEHGRGRGEGGGRGGRGGRGAEHGIEGRGGRGDGGRGRGEGGRGRGEGGRGGRGAVHGGRQPHKEEPAKPSKAPEHKTAGAVPDHLRQKGYILDEDEVPKTKIDNPFDLLNLADDE